MGYVTKKGQHGSGIEDSVVLATTQLQTLVAVQKLNVTFSQLVEAFDLDDICSLIPLELKKTKDSKFKFDLGIDIKNLKSMTDCMQDLNIVQHVHDLCAFTLRKDAPCKCDTQEMEEDEFDEELISSHMALPAAEASLKEFFVSFSTQELYHALQVLKKHRYLPLDIANREFGEVSKAVTKKGGNAQKGFLPAIGRMPVMPGVSKAEKTQCSMTCDRLRETYLSDLSKWIIYKVMNYYTLKTLYYTNQNMFSVVVALKFNLLWYRYVPDVKYLPVPVSLSPFVFVFSLALAFTVISQGNEVLANDAKALLGEFTKAFARFNQNKMRTIERLLMIQQDQESLKKMSMLKDVLTSLGNLLDVVKRPFIRPPSARPRSVMANRKSVDPGILQGLYHKVGNVRAIFRHMMKYSNTETTHDRLAHQMINIIWVACDIMQSSLAYKIMIKGTSKQHWNMALCIDVIKKAIKDNESNKNDNKPCKDRLGTLRKTMKCGCTDDILASALDSYVPFYKYTCPINDDKSFTELLQFVQKYEGVLDGQEIGAMDSVKFVKPIMRRKISSSTRDNTEYKYKLIMANAASQIEYCKHPVEDLMATERDQGSSDKWDIDDLFGKAIKSNFTGGRGPKKDDKA